MKSNINVDKFLAKIKKDTRAEKLRLSLVSANHKPTKRIKVILNYKDWDILDGRKKGGGKFTKKVTAYLYPALVVILCASLAFNIVNLF